MSQHVVTFRLHVDTAAILLHLLLLLLLRLLRHLHMMLLQVMVDLLIGVMLIQFVHLFVFAATAAQF